MLFSEGILFEKFILKIMKCYGNINDMLQKY